MCANKIENAYTAEIQHFTTNTYGEIIPLRENDS